MERNCAKDDIYPSSESIGSPGHQYEVNAERSVVDPESEWELDEITSISSPDLTSHDNIPDNTESSAHVNATTDATSLSQQMDKDGHIEAVTGDIKQGPLRELKKTTLTILLLGETGVGKTTFFSLLQNICAGTELYDFTPSHDPDNDTKLGASQSQTKSALVYEFTRYDGVLLRVLDTPGLCDTRGIEQDTHHKDSIARVIQEHIAHVDAVLVMANGTNQRLTIPTDYALTTLSTMFPASIAKNIAFLFTNVHTPLSFNFDPTCLPPSLQDAQLFTIENPLALLLKYRQLSTPPNTLPENKKRVFQRMLSSAYAETIEVLNDMFTWMDDNQTRPTAEIGYLYDISIGIEATIAGVISQLNQVEARRQEIDKLRKDLAKSKQTMKINEQFEKIMRRQMHEQFDTPDKHTTQCTVTDCYSNCHESCHLEFLLDPMELGSRCSAFSTSRERHPNRRGLQQRCGACNHLASEHRHFHSMWRLATKEERVVDENARISYKTAEQDAAAYEKQMELMQKTLHGFDEKIITLEARLTERCETFQNIALTGNFVGHISATLRMLKFRRDTKKASGDDEGMLALTKTIESFERKIIILKTAERKKQSRRDVLVIRLANDAINVFARQMGYV